MTKKQQREAIRLKFNNRCAYCGEPLPDKWHVDELLPCRRRYKTVKGHWSQGWHKNMTEDEMDASGIKWVDDRVVQDGYDFPERLHIDNQMPACPSCNINKHSMSLEEFRYLIQSFVNSLNNNSTQYKIAKRYGLIQETVKPVVFYFETYNVDAKKN